MSVELDHSPKIREYAHPEKLVSTEWLADHLGEEGLVVVESNEDPLLYATGHVPGAVQVDWHTDLNDPVQRDYLDGTAFAALMGARGIGRDDTIVLYGDRNNWWAAYTLWVFELFGHPDVRLLDGGRVAWAAEGREVSRDVPARPEVEYPVPLRDDRTTRVFRDDVMAHQGALVDIRSPEEYSGERTTAPEYPEESALRGGHIPGAVNVPWSKAVDVDGRYLDRDSLEAVYRAAGLGPDDDVVTYCRIGERSSHTWFALTYLLGFERVRNYDGSWTEWGNTVRVPIVRGPQPR
ncbi:sulfurtransferase [Curtobacterium sp. MCBD17_034]|uniref:sulfurtransferase n=1 Tax=unclassified Curtobacterium TaxID=257496 RepID=UPI000DA89EE4|nr:MULTISPECIES: sulfurtransferase [unclassified Curtobacterium]PZF62114.1 sulfurtransferase [Curtobacterium sp. MCBD17_034]PZM33951.1 sulfurtransferase [Curtobacterium sp. MCBD17_031]